MRRRCTRGPRALRRAARGRRYGWSWWATLNRRATPPPASCPPPRGAQHPPSGAHRPKGRAGSSALRPTTRRAPRRKVNGVAASTGDQRESSALQAMSDAVLAIAAELSVEAVPQRPRPAPPGAPPARAPAPRRAGRGGGGGAVLPAGDGGEA